jgi:hypothetical protein
VKNYTKEKRITKTLTSITCDKCGKTYDDKLELQEFLFINFVGGYSSVFGDMLRVECDICQYCLKDFLDSFGNYRQTEGFDVWFDNKE